MKPIARTVEYTGGYYNEKTGNTEEFSQSGEYVRRLILGYEPERADRSRATDDGKPATSIWKKIEEFKHVPLDIRQRVEKWRKKNGKKA